MLQLDRQTENVQAIIFFLELFYDFFHPSRSSGASTESEVFEQVLTLQKGSSLTLVSLFRWSHLLINQDLNNIVLPYHMILSEGSPPT